MCGERGACGGPASSGRGSSPRVRGTVSQRTESQNLFRFIPACAGNGRGTPSRGPRRSVHPRVCGERSFGVQTPPWTAGSSPRVRGTDLIHVRLSGVIRFIPACAGNGLTRSIVTGSKSVHPRVCGERLIAGQIARPIVGSSPRVRGTAELEMHPVLGHRFIPACAGNGRRRPTKGGSRSVHPRVCGERQCTYCSRCLRNGSSPRVRGTVVRGLEVSPRHRFIPACAGNGRNRAQVSKRGSVHPRVCGERLKRLDEAFHNFGSSPRVRGTGSISTRASQGVRFIPACAGNGMVPLTRAARCTVHPRVCGERLRRASSCFRSFGSSPRVRGTGEARLYAPPRNRFIPACAGNGDSRTARTGRSPVHPRVCGERCAA